MRSRSALSLFDSTLTPSTLPPPPPSNGAALKPSGPPAPPPPKDPRPFKPAGPDDDAEERRRRNTADAYAHKPQPAPYTFPAAVSALADRVRPVAPPPAADDPTPPDVRADIDRIAAAILAEGWLFLDPTTDEYKPRRRRWREETAEERTWREES